MAKITLELDDELHHKFKMYCAKSKMSMRTVLTIAIERIVKKTRS